MVLFPEFVLLPDMPKFLGSTIQKFLKMETTIDSLRWKKDVGGDIGEWI